jgi:hypothetical protein
MRTLRQEMDVPLQDVERKWLRRPVTLVLGVFVFIVSLGYHLAIAFRSASDDFLELFRRCW